MTHIELISSGCTANTIKFEDPILKGEEFLSLYQFNTKTAKHYFCSKCGIYTHHQRRSNPTQYGFNVACLEGVNPFELENVPVMDGVNHPSDK